MPPGSAAVCKRAATLTPSPIRSTPCTITSPRLIPMRKRTCRLGGSLSSNLVGRSARNGEHASCHRRPCTKGDQPTLHLDKQGGGAGAVAVVAGYEHCPTSASEVAAGRRPRAFKTRDGETPANGATRPKRLTGQGLSGHQGRQSRDSAMKRSRSWTWCFSSRQVIKTRI